jgi:transposase
MFDQMTLFGAALGIEEPIYIKALRFDKEAGELHIHLDFRAEARFKCSVCGAEGQPVYDTQDKTWRHLNFFQYKCYLHFRTPRTNCPECGVHLYTPQWGRKNSGFTMLFDLLVLTLSRSMPVSEIAELVGEHDTLLWRVIRYYVSDAYTRKDMSGVTKVGIDETSTRKGHNYISVFVDMEKNDVLYCAEGKDSGTIKTFADEMSLHSAKPDQITDVSMDMSPAFLSGLAAHLPKAAVTYDKFHVVKILNEALDKVRQAELKKNPLLLKRTRYLWLKNPGNLTAKQQEQLKTLSKENLRTMKAYQMKRTFQDIYRGTPDLRVARAAIKKWLSWAVRSRLEPMKAFARMLKSHMDGVLRYFKSGLTAGASEGMNSRIQYIKRRTRGFRNIRNFITMIYLDCSALNIPAFPTHSK